MIIEYGEHGRIGMVLCGCVAIGIAAQLYSAFNF